MGMNETVVWVQVYGMGSSSYGIFSFHTETAKTCSKNRNTLICDKSGRQHNSLCNFINTEEKVDYYGYCQV